MRYFLADIFLLCNLSKGVHFSGQGRRNARGFKKFMLVYSWKYGERNNRQCEKSRKISLFQALQKNSPPKPEGLCCMKVCYIRHAASYLGNSNSANDSTYDILHFSSSRNSFSAGRLIFFSSK